MTLMIDRSPLIPYVPIEYIVIEVTKDEAIMLQEVRKIRYGEITVNKFNGIINRIYPKVTIKVDEEEVTIDR